MLMFQFQCIKQRERQSRQKKGLEGGGEELSKRVGRRQASKQCEKATCDFDMEEAIQLSNCPPIYIPQPRRKDERRTTLCSMQKALRFA